MKNFKKIAIVSRIIEERIYPHIEKIVDLLTNEYDCDVSLNDSFAEAINFPQRIAIERLNEFDLIIVMGGDGTILWASRHSKEVPIFGINAGHLGFLTAATLNGELTSLKRIMSKDYVLERCMRLQPTLDGIKLPTALNEIYTTNKLIARISKLNISVNDFNLGDHLLDGLLVSTPVGSTAYAMSAGGSIIEHTIKAMHIVPVNSASISIRPFVVPFDSKITITVSKDFTGKIVIINDGILEGEFIKDSRLEIVKADSETVFIRFPDFGFFNRLQKKLGF
ncbi:MAG: NAD(+)/NADH kinase [Asgard group archaeon]|nr:NAD(+)/NADH kinase [Asgard group archaeon]